LKGGDSVIICDTTWAAHMTTLRTTVIMKTDIGGSTVRFRALPEVDLDALLTEHRHFVTRLAAAYDGDRRGTGRDAYARGVTARPAGQGR
jgi:hypothetical protein